MSPTVLRVGRLRFYFFTREEERVHIHVEAPEGEAKFWIEPEVELALNRGLSERDIHTAVNIIKEHRNELRSAWRQHFGG